MDEAEKWAKDQTGRVRSQMLDNGALDDSVAGIEPRLRVTGLRRKGETEWMEWNDAFPLEEGITYEVRVSDRHDVGELRVPFAEDDEIDAPEDLLLELLQNFEAFHSAWEARSPRSIDAEDLERRMKRALGLAPGTAVPESGVPPTKTG